MKDASDQVIVYLPRALGMCVSGSAAHERGKLQSVIDLQAHVSKATSGPNALPVSVWCSLWIQRYRSLGGRVRA